MRLRNFLREAGIAYTVFSFSENAPEPDEHSVGAAVMHMDAACDIVVAVGSGLVNDIGKILSALSRRPYIIVATTPSCPGNSFPAKSRWMWRSCSDKKKMKNPGSVDQTVPGFFKRKER